MTGSGFPRARGFLAVVLVLLAFSPATDVTASTASSRETGPLHYRGNWSGLHVADVTLRLQGTDDHYSGRLDIATRGILGWAYTWFGAVYAEGDVLDGPRLRPEWFHRSYVQGDDRGTVSVAYLDGGLALGIEDGKPLNDVAPTLRRGTVDPLAALVALRRHVAAGTLGRLTLPVFDGKRRLDLRAEIGLPRTTEVVRRSHRVVPVDADVVPVSGFNRRQKGSWEASRIRILFSADGRAVPVQITIDSPYGVAVLNLICSRGTTCPG